MASSSSSSIASSSRSALTALVADTRQEAGPLPSKRGEIGYREEVHGQQQQEPQQALSTDGQQPALPARHPADREQQVQRLSDSNSSTQNSSPSSNATSTTPPASSDAASTHSAGKLSIKSLLSRKRLPSFYGINLSHFLIFFAQLLIFGGTIAGWVIASQAMSRTAAEQKASDSDGSGDGGSMSTMTFGGGGATIFVHVAFSVITLAQLLIFERRIYHMRVARYMHLHPGEILPTSLCRSGRGGSLPLAPWQRPPIPTYAQTLAADGVGTGDVEDAEIARPPPPAYGQTRSSMLLLSGFMRDSLRAQARELEVDRSASRLSTRSDRPISFISRDEGWEEIRDASRARQLEETLARLEDGPGGSVSGHAGQ